MCVVPFSFLSLCCQDEQLLFTVDIPTMMFFLSLLTEPLKLWAKITFSSFELFLPGIWYDWSWCHRER